MLKYALDHDRGVPGPAGPWGVKGEKQSSGLFLPAGMPEGAAPLRKPWPQDEKELRYCQDAYGK